MPADKVMKKIKKSTIKPIMKIIDVLFLLYFYLTRMLLYVLPPGVLYAIYSGFGYALFYLLPGARKRGCDAVSQAMPELTDPRSIERIARSSSAELYKTMLDLAVFARHGERLGEELIIEGLEFIEQADSLGKGVICIPGHMGAWGIAMGVVARHGYLSTPIVMNPGKTFTPRFIKAIEDFADKIGASDGYIVSGKEDTIRKTQELLKEGRRLVVTVDVEGREIVEMFGRPVPLASGIGHFACDTGAPLLSINVLREKDPYKLRAVFRKPITYSLSGDRARDVSMVIQAAATAIEKEIRLAPEQWTQWGALGGWWKRAEELQKRSRESKE